MKKAILFLSLYCGNAAWAQNIPDPLPFARAITPEYLKKQLYVIASANFEGRETGMEGQRKAAIYIENEFRNLGLKPGKGSSYQLYFPVPFFQDSLEGATLVVNRKAFTLNKDFFVNISLNSNADLTRGEIIFAGYGISDPARNDYQGLNVRGKIVLVLGGQPTGIALSVARKGDTAKLEAAQKNGAAALLILQSGLPGDLRDLVSRIPLASPYNRVIYPYSCYITKEVAIAILGENYPVVEPGKPRVQSYPVNLRVSFKKSILQLQSSDVLGFIEGTDLKNQVVVVSAHYDHLGKRGNIIYYGADDDGSGTVSILAMAKAFRDAQTAGKGPRRSILFLVNSGEEKGLLGSQFYSEHPCYPLDRTIADLNIDMIGRVDRKRKTGDETNYVYVVGSGKLSTDLKPISEGINKKYSKLDLDYKFDDPKDSQRIYYRSDHYNFARMGVPVLFYFDGINEDYHKPTDTPDKINYNILEKRARFIFFTAWEMANRNEMIKRDIPLK